MRLREFIEMLDGKDKIFIYGGKYESEHPFKVKDINKFVPKDYNPEIDENISIGMHKKTYESDSEYKKIFFVDVKE
jgi:hypothetical protein